MNNSGFLNAFHLCHSAVMNRNLNGTILELLDLFFHDVEPLLIVVDCFCRGYRVCVH